MNLGFIYFIQESETERIKIGFSEKHPQGRLESFQTGNSNKLVLLGYIEGTQDDETRLHREFEEERIRKKNEWFEPSPELKKKIQDLLKENIKDKEEGIPEFDSNKKNDSGYDFGDFKAESVPEDFTGYGVETKNGVFRYEGQFLFGKPHGFGKQKTINGFGYEGDFKDGKYHGFGTVFLHESKFEGEFKNGKKDGNGTWIWFSGEWKGRKLQGEWKDGKKWDVKVFNSDGDLVSVFLEGVEKDPIVMGYNNEDEEKPSERSFLKDIFWFLVVTTPILIFLFW